MIRKIYKTTKVKKPNSKKTDNTRSQSVVTLV